MRGDREECHSTYTRCSDHGGEEPIFPFRTAFLVLLAVVFGCLIGGLTFAASSNLPSAVIAGLTTAGVVLYFSNNMVGR